MGFISKEAFMAQEKSKSERPTNFTAGPRVGYFSLKEDNDEAVVRFIYSNPDDIFKDIVLTHKTTIEGKFRRINCLRDFNDPMEKCPLCASGDPVQQRLYIKLVEYVRNDDGTITATPKIWERPTSYVHKLMDKAAEYGDISDCIFKVRRHGKPGDMKTDYSIDFANPNIYNSTLYVKDFSGFDNYNIIGSAVLSKTAAEMAEMTGNSVSVPASFEAEASKPAPWEVSTSDLSANIPEHRTTTSTPRKVTY